MLHRLGVTMVTRITDQSAQFNNRQAGRKKSSVLISGIGPAPVPKQLWKKKIIGIYELTSLRDFFRRAAMAVIAMSNRSSTQR